MTLRAIDQTSPTAENVTKLAGPATSGVEYLAGGWLKLAYSTGNLNEFIVSVQNPFGVPVIIAQAIVASETAGATGTVDFDVVSCSSGSGDDIFDGLVLDSGEITVIASAAGSTAEAGANAEINVWRWEEAGSTAGLGDYLTAELTQIASTGEGHIFVQCLDAG